MEKDIYDFLDVSRLESAAKSIANPSGNSRTTSEELGDSVHKIFISGTSPVIMKKSSLDTGIAGIASAKLYKDLGIHTPQILPLKNNKENLLSIQQDVSSIDFLNIILADSDTEYTKIEHKAFGKDKLSIFYNIELETELLKFMTPECLDQLKNVFLLDEIRTDIDRHTKNYFFYKSKNSNKYEGIIAIDLELMAIYNLCGTKKDDFQNFLYMPYESVTPQQKNDFVCYLQRVRDIRELIQSGELSKSNLEVLTNALRRDFPADIKTTCKTQKLHGKTKNKIVTPIERLWEYNQKTIGKDLGL